MRDIMDIVPNTVTPDHSPASTLQSHNVRIHRRRTSIRLEPAMWAALNEIAAAEKCSIHDLCGAVHDLKEQNQSFTAALRVFLMEYYRTATRANSYVSSVQRKVRGEGEVSVRSAV